MRWLKMSAIALLGIGWTAFLFAQEDDPANAAAKPSGPRKWALLIGINDYAEISDLKYCRRDMEVLRERLVAAGFPEEQISLLHDGAKQSLHQPFKTSIEHHLDLLLEKVEADDLVVFAFSGHGIDLDGASYICPIEARLTAPKKTLVSLEYVYRRFADCRAGQKILLVDACRDNPRPGGQRAVLKSTDSIKGFARSLSRPPKGILVLTSCKPGQMSVEDDKLGHSVFMHFILKGLRGEADRVGGNGNGQVSLFELYRYADLRTRAYVARSRDLIQTPVLRGQVTADLEIADVVTRTQEIEAVWASIREDPEAFIEDSPVLQWLEQMYLRMMTGNASAEMTTKMEQMVHQMVRRPEAIVLSNPLLVTASKPEALLAIQRAYAFGVRGDWDGAIGAATEAIRLEPENPFAYLMRGMAHLGKASNLRMAEMLMGVQGDSNYIASMLQLAQSNRMIAARVREVLAELGKAAPELIADLEKAKQDPAQLRQAVETAIEKMRSTQSLEAALKDYQKIGLGVPLNLAKDTQVMEGSDVIGRVAGYFEYCEGKGLNGDWIGVKRENGQEGWVEKKHVNQVHCYFELFQLVVQ